ncbi:MAG: creatininase family protein [Candidatus Bathyarchaeia archaeon]
MSGTMKVYWHEHTMRELAELMPKLEVVIIPTGSTEVHGHHLGVGNDILSVSKVCEEAAKRMYPRALVVRALWVGFAPHNMCKPFTGTLTLRAETYIQVLYEVAESLQKYGVKRIVFVNGHGGNVEPNLVACRKIREELHYRYGVDLEVGCFSYWEVIPREAWENIMEAERGIGHGGEAETSILLAAAPQAVRTDYIEDPPAKPEAPPSVKVHRAHYNDEYYLNAHTYGSHLATKEKGEKLLEAAVEGTVVALEEYIRFKPVQTHRYPKA